VHCLEVILISIATRKATVLMARRLELAKRIVIQRCLEEQRASERGIAAVALLVPKQVIRAGKPSATYLTRVRTRVVSQVRAAMRREV
jgi:hypothetical protein